MPHSAAFLAVRDALLRDIDDADRRRLTGLFGSMTDPLPDLSPELTAVVAAIVTLDADDRLKLARWVRTYVTRWGQVPSAPAVRYTTRSAADWPRSATSVESRAVPRTPSHEAPRIRSFRSFSIRCKQHHSYHEDVFAHFEPKVQSNVNAQVAQVLSPFNHPDLVDAFCTEAGAQARMDSVLEGAVYLVALPLALYGLGAKTAYTFIKLRFFNLMQRRRLEKGWNQSRPVFFLCDEYQEIVSCAKDGVSDLNFWDKSRSSGCIGVISAQGVSSFYAAIGDRDLADTVLQNFRQTICFRTEDRATIERMNFLLGAVDVARISENVGNSTTTGHGSSSSAGYGLSLQRQNVITPQLFRQLRQNDALALLSIGGNAYDDVLTMPPVLVNI